jgi:hypothetical protein
MRVHVCTLSSRRVSQSISSMRRAVRAKQLEFVHAEQQLNSSCNTVCRSLRGVFVLMRCKAATSSSSIA